MQNTLGSVLFPKDFVRIRERLRLISRDGNETVSLDLDFSISGDDVGRILLIVLIVVAVVGLTFWSSQRLRSWYADKVEPQLHEFRTGLTAVVSSAKRLLLLFGGNIGSQVLYGAVLANLVFLPLADKLAFRSSEEVLLKTIPLLMKGSR